VHYSAITAHALLAEIVRRLDGGRRRFGAILAEDVLDPARHARHGPRLRADLAKRKVPIVVRDRSPASSSPSCSKPSTCW
jgi:hypothetical protein